MSKCLAEDLLLTLLTRYFSRNAGTFGRTNDDDAPSLAPVVLAGPISIPVSWCLLSHMFEYVMASRLMYAYDI